MAKLKVYVDTTTWYVRPKNTDWLYMQWINQMSRYEPLEFIYEHNIKEIASETIFYLRNRLTPCWKKDSFVRHASSKVISKGLADVVFSHSRFPVFNSPVPIVWSYGVIDPIMQNSVGIKESEIFNQYLLQSQGFKLATKVLLPSIAQVERHSIHFPDFSDKFSYAPFFLPGLQAASHGDVLLKQQHGDKIRLLFVGREGKRKGLDVLIEALSMLSKTEHIYFSLDVVSVMADGPIPLISGVDTKWHKSLPRNQVLSLMHAAHVFIMPSRFETYGFTLIEALAAGCVVIGPNWEAQREILDSGRSGINVRSSAEDLCSALIGLLNHKNRCQLALAGLEKFNQEYSAKIVAKKHMKIFEMAVGT